MNSSVMNFLKKYSIVYSPDCHSLRYVMSSRVTPEADKKHQTIQNVSERRAGTLMSPFPRFLTKLDMYYNFKFSKFSFTKEAPEINQARNINTEKEVINGILYAED